MAGNNTYITEPVPQLNAEAVREYEYRSLAAVVLAAAGSVDKDDPDFQLWKQDRAAWAEKRKRGNA